MESCISKEITVRNYKSEEDEISMPKVFDAKVEPLFSLPPELRDPEKWKRKADVLFKEKEKIRKFREGPYTVKRLRQEGFRR